MLVITVYTRSSNHHGGYGKGIRRPHQTSAVQVVQGQLHENDVLIKLRSSSVAMTVIKYPMEGLIELKVSG